MAAVGSRGSSRFPNFAVTYTHGVYELALFVVDCSKTMGEEKLFEIGVGDYATSSITSGLEILLRYLKAKIAQRIMRELRTTPIGVLTYGVKKTKNVLTSQMQERDGTDYDKDEDPYRHFCEHVPITFSPDSSTIDSVTNTIRAGRVPDDCKTGTGDAHSAIILAMETIENTPKAKSYKKEIYLLTDGESKSDWDGVDGTIEKLKERKISLTVVGINFEDPELDKVEANKSEIKKENENMFNRIVDELEEGVVAAADRALDAIAAPALKSVNSQVTTMKLTFGDVEDYPDSSLVIQVDVKKAVSAAAVKSMKKMSTKGFDRTAPRSSARDSSSAQRGGDAVNQTDDASQSMSQRAGFGSAMFGGLAGEMGMSYEKLLDQFGFAPKTEGINDSGIDTVSHDVQRETRYFYRPADLPLDQVKKDEGEEEPDDDDEPKEPELRPANGNVELTDAYYYGGALVPVGDLENGAGELRGNEMGMKILGFMKMSEIRYDWRLNDVQYVYGSKGQTGSQMMLSAFIISLIETSRVMIVRHVGKGMNRNGIFKLPDPKICILFPVQEVDQQFFYMCQFPFAEDVRDFAFSSFTRLFNARGERLTEHRLLATAAQEEAMDKYVESMNLMYAEPDEDGKPRSWFDVNESYSPAIHNIQNTLVFRLSDAESELPAPPTVLTQYMNPPIDVVLASEEARKAAVDAFDVKLVPPKPKKINKKSDAFAADEPDIQFDRLFTRPAAPVPSPSRSNSANSFSGQGRTLAEPPPRAFSASSSSARPSNVFVSSQNASQSQSMDVDPSPPSSLPTRKADVLPRPKASPEKYSMDLDDDEEASTGPTLVVEDDEDEDEEPPTDDEGDAEMAPPPPRTTTQAPAPTKVGVLQPVEDFRALVASQGVEKAMPSLFAAVGELVKTSFSTAKYPRALEAVQAAKAEAQKQKSGKAAFNTQFDSLVAKFKANPKKEDFVALLEKEGVKRLG